MREISETRHTKSERNGCYGQSGQGKQTGEKKKTDKLTALIKDKDKEVRLAAIEGLGNVPENEDSLNTLIKCMENDSDADIRKAAAVTLGDSEGDYIETHLRYCLSHEKDESVLAAIRESLSKIKGQ